MTKTVKPLSLVTDSTIDKTVLSRLVRQFGWKKRCALVQVSSCGKIIHGNASHKFNAYRNQVDYDQGRPCGTFDKISEAKNAFAQEVSGKVIHTMHDYLNKNILKAGDLFRFPSSKTFSQVAREAAAGGGKIEYVSSKDADYNFTCGMGARVVSPMTQIS